MFSTLFTPEFFWIVLLGVGLLGLMVGSFLNVVIIRLPKMLLKGKRKAAGSPRFNLMVPASHCPHCEHPIHWYHNIPLFSYIWLKGKCAYCSKAISLRYPLVELLTLVLSVIVAIRFQVTPTLLAGLILTWSLIALTFIDIDHQILPDDITLPLLWIGLFVNAFGILTDPASAILGAIFGYFALFAVYWAFRLITGKEGMGFGDFKLLALLGAWLGWQALPFIILVSSLLGSILGLSLMHFKGMKKDTPIPYGPFLAFAGFLSLIWGPSLTLLYYKLMVL